MRWMWIDRIVGYEAGRRMVAVKCISLGEGHLHDHFAGGVGQVAQPIMPASLIIEGMAQTAGILVGSVHRFREKVILAKIVRAELVSDAQPGDVLRYDATLERIDGLGASTTGLVDRAAAPGLAWESLGRIDLLFSHIDQNRAGLEFPKENFVFGENFRTILRSAGLIELAPPA